METVLEVKDLCVTYQNKSRSVYAVKDVSFSINQGDSLGIVGESGSGKSTLAMAILRLLPPKTAQVTGEAYFQGGYSMLANCGVSLNIEDPSGQVVTLGLDKTGEYEPESVWTNGLVGTLASGDEVYSFDYSDSYQIADGTYELTLDFLSSDVSQLLITSSGAFSDVVKV